MLSTAQQIAEVNDCCLNSSCGDPRAVTLTEESSREGALLAISYARPGKLFTGNTRLMTSRVGDLEVGLSHGIVQVVITMLQKGIA